MNEVEHMGFVRPVGRGGRGRSNFVYYFSNERERELEIEGRIPNSQMILKDVFFLIKNNNNNNLCV